MPIYSRIINSNTTEIKVRGETKMNTMFPQFFEHTIPIMKCDVPLRTGITYPRELWDKIIYNKLYDLPVYGQKDEPTTKIGQVTDVKVKNNIVYVTVSIDTSSGWGAYVKNELVEKDKFFIKPYLLCKLDNYKIIDPDDFILKSFYCIDYSEDVIDFSEQVSDKKEDKTEINFNEVKKATDDIYQEENKGVFKSDNIDTKIFENTSNIFSSKEMPSNQELLEKFNSVSDTESIFKNADSQF